MISEFHKKSEDNLRIIKEDYDDYRSVPAVKRLKRLNALSKGEMVGVLAENFLLDGVRPFASAVYSSAIYKWKGMGEYEEGEEFDVDADVEFFVSVLKAEARFANMIYEAGLNNCK